MGYRTRYFGKKTLEGSVFLNQCYVDPVLHDLREVIHENRILSSNKLRKC